MSINYCRCGHGEMLHVDHFINGRQECDVDNCPCERYEVTPKRVQP